MYSVIIDKYIARNEKFREKEANSIGKIKLH